MRNFVEAMGELGYTYDYQYNQGNRDVIAALQAEEANLLRARDLARANGWWYALAGTMQGLRSLYAHTGRRAEWEALVAEIVPDFVDPATDGPLPGREEQWGLITEYRVFVASDARQWDEAERLLRVWVDWERRRTAKAVAALDGQLDESHLDAIQSLGSALHTLGQLQLQQGDPGCISTLTEAMELAERIDDRPHAAVAAFNLGHAYKNVPALRDLAQAERWYRRSLELVDERDRLGRAKCVGQLGQIAYEHFKEARAGGLPERQQMSLLDDTLQFYHQALDLLPPDAANDLAVTHGMLGSIYGDAGDLNRALMHYREAIRYTEAADNVYEAATHHFNAAIDLSNAGRLDDALAHARAALSSFSTFGDSAAADSQETQGVIAMIEQARSTH